MKLLLITLNLFVFLFIIDVYAEEVKKIDDVDMVYHEMAALLFTESINEKNSDLIDDLNKHGAEKVYSILTSSISQTFYIFFIRNNLSGGTKVDNLYKMAIRGFLRKVGKNNVEQVIRKGWVMNMDGKENLEFRSVLIFFNDEQPTNEELEKSLKLYLSIN